MSKILNFRFLLLLLLFAGSFQCFSQVDSIQFGKASFYAEKFNLRKTANGETFNMDSLTAAHKSLPFGTVVKVTNLSNDSTVIVRINDRLPLNSKRVIDLSKEAARRLKMIQKGITKVKIEIIPPRSLSPQQSKDREE